MSIIHKNSPQYKIWKKRNDLKKQKRKQKRKRNYKKINAENNYKRSSSHPYKSFRVPEIFSIIKNPEETINFLNYVIKHVENFRIKVRTEKNNNNIKTFKIEMGNTKEITGDALMYLLTIIRNTRGKKILPINWWGNFPEDEKMKKFLIDSGYLKYMKTAKENLIETTDNIQIQIGHGYEYNDGEKIIDIRQKIIDYSCKKLAKNKTQLNFLMTMLTEMITNIQDHAYDKENIFEHSWYIFVEDNNNKISYTFMDNGLGIPTTIRKKVIEKILKKLEIDKEYKYIDAGVSGIQKRSQTGLSERGNGLPSIYEQYTSNKIKELTIISNRAYYSKCTKKDLDNNLNGTIFYWEINKEVDIEDGD